MPRELQGAREAHGDESSDVTDPTPTAGFFGEATARTPPQARALAGTPQRDPRGCVPAWQRGAIPSEFASIPRRKAGSGAHRGSREGTNGVNIAGFRVAWPVELA